MNITDTAVRRRPSRLARWGLAVMAVAMAAAACTHQRPPTGPPNTDPTATPTTKVVCPRPTDDGPAGGDLRPLPCPPICPQYADGPDAAAIPARCPCPLTADDTFRPCRPCPPGPVRSPDVVCPCVAPSPAGDMIPCRPVPPGGVPGLLATRDFAAWVNAMPGPDPSTRKLIVTGTLVFNTAGYKARLVPANPQGFNPRILLLNLEVTPPSGSVAQVVTEQPIRFESPATDYDRVTILPVGIDLEVEIAR